jgi:tetratricopeptide (TPR) repeat protein
LAEAVEDGDAAKVSALLRDGASPKTVKDGSTVLGTAVWRGDVAITRLLLAAGADPNGAAPDRHPPAETPLVLAARRCDEKIVRILIDGGANARGGPGGTALVWALITAQSVGSRTATAMALIEAGAELNGPQPQSMKTTPLEAAVNAGEFAVARAMISRGADVQASIAAAEKKGNVQLASALRKALLSPPEPAATGEAATASIESLAELIRRVEAVEDRSAPPSWRVGEELLPSDGEVDRAITDVATYLKANPSDAAGYVLWARLARLRPRPPQRPQEISPTDIIGALKRAVKLAPGNADAQYWLGRGYSDPKESTTDGIGRYSSIDQAVEHLRKAVQLAPTKVAYRETLAFSLADQGRPGEAKTILQAAASGDTLMIGLLSDLEAVPIPPGAQLLSEHPLTMTFKLQLAQGGLEDHWRLRLRTYELSTTRDRVSDFYQSRWPGFEFIREDSDEASDTPRDEQNHLLFQYLRWQNGKLTWVDSESEIPQMPKEGMQICVIEATNEETRRPTRLLVLTNFRR